MALFKCTECGYEMSSHATKCPKCGCPIEDILKEYEYNQQKERLEKRTYVKKKIISIFIVLILILGSAMIYRANKIVPLDYAYIIGTNYNEHKDVHFEEETWWSTMSPDDPKIYEANYEYEFMNMAGEITYRYMDGDYYEHRENLIYVVSWQPFVEEDNESEIISEKKLDKLIRAYNKLYGAHMEQKDEFDETTTEYVWKAGENIDFTIQVSEGRTDIYLSWLEVEKTTI